MASFVNEDGVPLNVIEAVHNDRDARNLASHLRGPRREQARSLSREDEEVHEAYEALLPIVKNPRNFTESQIVDTIVAIKEADDSPVQKYGSFSGNYNADLADRDSNVYKFWRNYKSKKKNRRNLGQQINYLLGKVDEILENEGYKKEEESAAAYMPSSANLKRQARARELLKGKSLPNISALKLRAKQRKEERRKRMEAAAVTSTAKPKAEASAKPSAKPSVKVITRPSGKEEEWIGPFTSRSTGKQYWTRKEDKFSVYVSSNGELTEGKIRATEAAKAKAEAKKAAKKADKGGGRTRKKRGKGKQKKRKPPKSKKNRNPTEERVAKAIKAAKNKQRDRIVGLRQPALVVPDDDLVHSDDFAAGIFDPNAPESDEFSSGIGLTHQEENEGVASAAAVDDDGSGWGQFSSVGFNGGRRKTRKMKGGHHLYKRLGVSKYASQKQIKKAYNKLKKKKKLTKKVKYAYKILSKKKSRKKYNAKYKKHKKHKKSKKRRKGGLPHAIVEGKVFPSGYTPEGEVSNPQPFREPTWIRQL